MTKNVTVFSDKKLQVKAYSVSEALRLHKDLLANLCIQRGEKTPLVPDGSLRKYHLKTHRLGLSVYAYVNRSKHFYNAVEQLASPPQGKMSKALEDRDKIVLELPDNSRKLVLLRYPPERPEELQLKEATYKIKA